MIKIIESKLGLSEMHEPMRSELRERMIVWVVCVVCVILFFVITLGCE
jgi:hypothetical protein